MRYIQAVALFRLLCILRTLFDWYREAFAQLGKGMLGFMRLVLVDMPMHTLACVGLDIHGYCVTWVVLCCRTFLRA